MNTSTQRPAAESQQEFTRARPLLGTFVEITAGGLPPPAAQQAIDRAFAEVEAVHASMSYQSPDSELTQLNRHAAGQPIAVSDALWQVLQAGQEMAQASDGLFDVTVAPALTRLGYLPRHAGVPRADRHANWQHVRLLRGRRVHFARPLRIDLSGIAKGYAVDRALAALRACGAQHGQVNAGGDLRLFGAQAAQTVRVRHPALPGLTLPVIELRDGAVATSANYYTQRQYGGRTVSPLLGPGRRSACGGQTSVTVQAADCMTADALTKVVHADPQRALPVLRRFGAEALLLQTDPANGNCLVFDTRTSA